VSLANPVVDLRIRDRSLPAALQPLDLGFELIVRHDLVDQAHRGGLGGA
jgi:hypothetical protein